MLKLVFLSKAFYEAYKECPEIEQKQTRPYISVQILIDGVLWAIPLRSNIKHSHAIWTDKKHQCGIDLTKAVVVEKPEDYISEVEPYIRPNEFKVLKTIDQYWVAQKLSRYIDEYKTAKQHPEIRRNRDTLRYSTLQYFEQYL